MPAERFDYEGSGLKKAGRMRQVTYAIQAVGFMLFLLLFHAPLALFGGVAVFFALFSFAVLPHARRMILTEENARVEVDGDNVKVYDEQRNLLVNSDCSQIKLIFRDTPDASHFYFPTCFICTDGKQSFKLYGNINGADRLFPLLAYSRPPGTNGEESYDLTPLRPLDLALKKETPYKNGKAGFFKPLPDPARTEL